MERLRDFIEQLKNFKNRRHTQKDYDQLFKTFKRLKFFKKLLILK